MDRRIFRSKPLVSILLVLFAAFWAGEGFARTAGQEQTEFTKAFQAGKKLYEDGEHKEAALKLLQALTFAKEKAEITEACFYLSLAYYGLGESANAQLYLKKLFEADPGREIDARLFPSGYVTLFYRTKSELAGQKPAKVEEKPKVEAKAEAEKKPTAVPGKAEPEVKKKGKFPWLIVGGLVVAAGVVLYLVLGKKSAASGSSSNMGTISVSSTPSGAKVSLDGADTGLTTPCTLSNVIPGTHTVRLVKDGYADAQQTVTVTAGQTATVNASLTKNTIAVTSPSAGVTWAKGASVDIRWQVSGDAQIIKGRGRSGFTGANDPGKLPGRSEFIDNPGAAAGRGERSGSKSRRSENESDTTPPAADPKFSASPGTVLQAPGLLAITKVKIELYKSGSVVNTIAAETDNNGSYTWTVPAILTDGSDYKVRVSCSTDSSVYGESGTITISVGSITVTMPSSGTLWTKGFTFDILWTSSAVGNVKIELFKGTALSQTISSDTLNDGSYSWAIPASMTDSSDYRIRISLVSNASITGESGMFTISGGGIVVTAPLSGSIWSKASTYNIQWMSTAAGNVNISLYRVTTLIQTIVTNTANDGSHAWTIGSGLTEASDYRIRITSVSDSTIFGEGSYFTIGTPPYEFVTKWGSLGSGDGQFWEYGPNGITVDSSGYVYVADNNNHRIQKFTSSGQFVSKWGSYGSGDGQFNGPHGMTFDASGNIYVADTSNNRIQKFTSSGQFLAKYGTFGNGDGQFDWPEGIARDSAGNFYTAEYSNSYNNERVQKFDSNFNFLLKWGSQGTGDGQFKRPQGIATDNLSNIYVAETNNYRVQKFNANSQFVTKWGSYGSGDGQFRAPFGIAVDSTGNVYVVDWSNDRVQKFTSTGTFVAKWGSNGTGDGQFSNPSAVAVDSSGNIYVTEYGNNRVQKFRPRTSAPPQEIRAPGFLEMISSFSSRLPRH